MAHDVFISHSSKDKQTTDMICRHLERQGIRCWMAPRDISPGQDWAEAIVDAIGSSRLMLLIFSSHANDSNQINREISVASEANIPIVPCRIEEVQPSKKLKYYLSTPHWLDALPPPVHNHLEYLTRSILRFLPEVAERLKNIPAPRSQPEIPAARIPVAEISETGAALELLSPDIRAQARPARHPFSFDEAHEKASRIRVRIAGWIGFVSTIFLVISLISSVQFVGSGERKLRHIFLFFGCYILSLALTYPLAYWARTSPIYAIISTTGANASIFALIALSYVMNFTAGDDDAMRAIYGVWFFLTIIVATGLLAKVPLIWLYGAPVSAFMIFFGLSTGRILIPLLGLFTLNLSFFAAYQHGQMILKKMEATRSNSFNS